MRTGLLVLIVGTAVFAQDTDTIRNGEHLVESGHYKEALLEYQRVLDIDPDNSLAHYRVGEVYFLQHDYVSAANAFHDANNGDRKPEWTEVWAHIQLGMIFDTTGQRERAVKEYELAIRTGDNTRNAQRIARKYLETAYRRPRQ